MKMLFKTARILIPLLACQALGNVVGPTSTGTGAKPLGEELQVHISAANLRDHLEAAMKEIIFVEQAELQIDFVRQPAPIPIAPVPFEVRVDQEVGYKLKSRFMLPFSVWQNGQKTFESQVYAKAKLLKEVWVVTERIQPNRPVGMDMLTIEMRDVLATSGQPLTIAPQLPEYTARYSVMPGRILLQHHVRRRPVYQRGDIIEAIYQRGALRIALKAECLDAAAPGSTVRLRNPNTKKQINGYVHEDKSVTIL